MAFGIRKGESPDLKRERSQGLPEQRGRSVRKRSLGLSVRTDLPAEQFGQMFGAGAAGDSSSSATPFPIQRGQHQSQDQEAFAFVCSKITEHIFISGFGAANNLDTLRENGINCVLNLTPQCPNCFPQHFVYKRVLLRDHAGEDISKCLFGCLAFIENAAQHNQRVLVHCTKGISRSSTVVIAYLMLKRSWDMQKALQFTKQQRPIINPNCAFFFQLSDWEGSWPQAQFKNSGVLVYQVWAAKSSGAAEDGCNIPQVEGPVDPQILSKLDSPDPSMQEACYIICSREGGEVWRGAACPPQAFQAGQQAFANFQVLGQLPATTRSRSSSS